MRYLERHDLIGKHLLTTDAAAGYVILDYWPQQKVFIDDRYDMYPTSVIYDYFDLTGAKPGWSQGARQVRRRRHRVGQGHARSPRCSTSPTSGSVSTATPPTRSGCELDPP